MAEHPDRPTPWPHRFGVAGELDRGAATAARRTPVPASVSASHPLDHRVWQCRARARQTPIGGRTWAHVLAWWASRDRGAGHLWHRVLCRRGRHDVRGGQQVQLGSRFVNVERCCVRCGAVPPPLSSQTTAASGPVSATVIR